MLDMFFKVLELVWGILKLIAIPIGALLILFFLLCSVWYLIFKFKYKMHMPPSGQVRQKKQSICELPQFVRTAQKSTYVG